MRKRIEFLADEDIINDLDLIRERWEANAADAGTKYTLSELIRNLIITEAERLKWGV